MVKAKGRPINPNINCDFTPCIRCDYVLEKIKYGFGPSGKRNRVCPTCREKEHTKKTQKLEYNLEEFDISRIGEALKTNTDDKTGTTIGIFGQSKLSGKTTLLKHIISKYEKSFDFVILFTVNTQARVYKELENKNNVRICFKFDPKIVNLFHKINSEVDLDKRLSVLFILDDEIDSKLNATLRNMILTYRNMNISTIISSQTYAMVDKNSRSNFNFVFLGKYNSDVPIKDLSDIYLTSALSMDVGAKKGMYMLVNFYRDKTENNHFLVVDGTEQNFKIRIYKANI
jgi:hypothetical protein